MKISVITVVYNAVNCLEQTILSIINQNYKNIEFIVIDGGSDDGTLEIIKKYSANIAYWVSEKDNGIYEAMNKGVKVATGDWAYFLGAGDLALNVFDKLLLKLNDKNTIYYGDVYRTDILEVFAGYFSTFRSSRMCICHQAIIYPISAVKKYQYDLKYKVQGDHNLNMQLIGDRDYKFKYIPIILCVYQGNGFSSITIDQAFFKDRLSIVKKNFPIHIYIGALMIDKFAKFLNRGPYKNKVVGNNK